MIKSISLAALLAFSTQGFAASIVNNDNQAHTVVVTEGGSQQQLLLNSGDSADICPDGCFVSLDGERATLLGSEAVEIVGGKLHVR